MRCSLIHRPLLAAAVLDPDLSQFIIPHEAEGREAGPFRHMIAIGRVSARLRRQRIRHCRYDVTKHFREERGLLPVPPPGRPFPPLLVPLEPTHTHQNVLSSVTVHRVHTLSVQISLSTSHKGGAGRPKEFSSHRGQLIWTRPFPPLSPCPRRERSAFEGGVGRWREGCKCGVGHDCIKLSAIVIIDHRAIGRRKVAFWHGMSECDAMRWSDDRRRESRDIMLRISDSRGGWLWASE